MELNSSDHQVLGHHSNQSPSPSIAQFGQEASSKKKPGCFKLLPLRVTENACFCDPSMKQNLFWTLPQMCGLTQTCFWALQAVLLTSGLVFCSDMHYKLLDLLLRCVCLFKSYPFNWICHRLTSHVKNMFFALPLWCMECRLMWEKSNLKQFNKAATKNVKKMMGYEYFLKALYVIWENWSSLPADLATITSVIESPYAYEEGVKWLGYHSSGKCFY